MQETTTNAGETLRKISNKNISTFIKARAPYLQCEERSSNLIYYKLIIIYLFFFLFLILVRARRALTALG